MTVADDAHDAKTILATDFKTVVDDAHDAVTLRVADLITDVDVTDATDTVLALRTNVVPCPRAAWPSALNPIMA